MANELKKLIREAFNIAYSDHKSKKINEDSASMGASLEANGQKQVADEILKKLIESPVGKGRLFWSPQGGSEDGKKINEIQLNYIVERLVELYKQTKDSKYKMIIAYIYSPFAETSAFKHPDGKTVRTVKNKPLYDFMLNKFKYSTELERLMEKDPEIFREMIADIWNWMFVDGTVTPDKGAFKGQKMPTFDRIVSEYIPRPNSNFGALISTYFNYLKNSIRAESTKDKTVSMDAPMSNGKSHDFGDEIRDSAETTSATGDEEEDVENEFSNLVAPDDTKEERARFEAKQNITAIFKSLFQAIKEFKEYHEATPNQINGIKALELFIKGLSPQDTTKILGYNSTTAFGSLKDSKEFTRIVDDYFLANGVLGSRGKAMSFSNLMPLYIGWAAKFFKTKDASDIQGNKVDKSDDLDNRGTIDQISSQELERRKKALNQGVDVKKMLVLKNSIKRGIKDFKNIGDLSPEQVNGLNALEIILNTGAHIQDIAAELGYNVENDIKLITQNSNFLQKINDILVPNLEKYIFLPGIDKNIADKDKANAKAQAKIDAENEALSDIDLDYLSKISNYIKTGSENSLAEEISEKFVVENLSKIMERVYIRLKKRL